MSHQHDEAVFSYSGCLSFDGKGNVTLSVEDFNRLLGRDGYACRLELEAGRLRTALAASEARLDSMTLHYAEVLHDARGKQDVAEADSAALRAVLREVLGIWRSESGCECVSCAALHARATALSASPCDAKVECEECKRMREALERIAKCGPASVDGECTDCDSECIEQANIARAALAASPCDAKVECEGCKGMRTALEVRESLIAKLREPTEEHRRWVALMDGTPDGTAPMTVYSTKDGKAIVCGDPSDEPDDADESRHNCDAMGCTTFSHVLWRGSVESFWAMCETAASAMLDDAALAATKGGEVGTHEERWARLGWPFKWDEMERKYAVPIEGGFVWRRTVAAVDAWIAAKGGDDERRQPVQGLRGGI